MTKVTDQYGTGQYKMVIGKAGGKADPVSPCTVN